MEKAGRHDAWAAGQNYEIYMGRWSSLIADRYIDWMGAPQNADWLDLGAGTGALSRSILMKADPKSVVGIEPSEGFVAHARALTKDPRASFKVGGAGELPLTDKSVDVAASALVLNFVPDKAAALHEMARVTRQGGIISFYVWDYPNGGMGFIDVFWKTAAALDAKASELDEADRFPFCTEAGLRKLCESAGFNEVETAALEIETVFPSFDDFIHPFTLGAGPAPGYYASLDAKQQAALDSALSRRLGTQAPIRLNARAWAVKIHL